MRMLDYYYFQRWRPSYEMHSSVIPAEFWSHTLTELSWDDVATRAALLPPGGTGRKTQHAVVCRWPRYSTTLQPGWRRSHSWPHTHTQHHGRLLWIDSLKMWIFIDIFRELLPLFFLYQLSSISNTHFWGFFSPEYSNFTVVTSNSD